MPRPLILACLALAAAAAAAAQPAGGAPRETLRVGILNSTFVPWLYVDAETGEQSGIEFDLREGLCAQLGADCEVVFLAELEDRIAALESGEVDLVIYGFSVTAERAESVRFVRPFYAFEGGDLYQSPAAPLSPAPAAWADLAGESICVEAGSYLVGPLQDLGVAPFEVDSALDYGTAIANGSCVAGASDDYSALEEGLERVAAVGALEPRPYAVAVAKNATSDELALRVSGALVALLTGPDAPLVASERLGFAQIGVDPGPAVAQLSRALTTMDACPAEAAEGAAPPPASAARCRGLAAVAAAAAAAAALL